MRAIIAYICLAVLFGVPAVGQATEEPLEAALFDELHILFPDSTVEGGVQKLETDTPYGTSAGIHLLVMGVSNQTISISVEERGLGVANVKLSKLLEVYTKYNSGLNNGVEPEGAPQNPYVIRDAPFGVFDILEPCTSSTEAIEGVSMMAFRIDVPVLPVESRTNKTYSIGVTVGGETIDLEWVLSVHPVAVKPASESTFHYTNWFDTKKLAQNYREIKKIPAAWEALVENYNEMVLRSRQNMQLSAIPATMKDGAVLFDHEAFDKQVAWNRTHGYRMEIGHICHDPWGAPELTLQVSKKDINEPGQIEILQSLLEELSIAIQRNQLENAVIHIRDEVVSGAVSRYKTISNMVRSELPGVRIIDAVNCDPAKLEGYIDEWVPLPQDFLKYREFYERRKMEGDSVWYYVCHNPGGQWINRMIDQERIRSVYLGWALVHYDLDGFLHWGFNYGNHSVAADATFGGILPPGDANLVYPAEASAFSSQRLEAMRIGMEDADLLQELKDKNPQQAAAIINLAFRSFTDYTTDINIYREAKRLLLTALDSNTPPKDFISINFTENSNQTFSGGELIGPLFSDSALWNVTSGESGSLAGLINGYGLDSGVSLEWQSSLAWQNNDGTADDEHKLSVGYLDDGDSASGNGVTLTLSNIPYPSYRVYGLFSSDSAQQSLDFQVNGTWVYGGSTPSTASVHGSIDLNQTNHDEFWTEIVPGAVTGNYWTVEASGTTCTITGRIKQELARGSLSGLIIEEIKGVDEDSDGLDDGWEVLHFNTITAQTGAGDADGDGVTNAQEEALGSDPNDPAFPGSEYAGLRAWWKLDETLGTTAGDSSGNRMNASNTGGVLVGQSSQNNGSFVFNGLDGSSSTLGTDAPNSSNLTITAWIRPGQITDRHTIVGKENQFILMTEDNKLRMVTFPKKSYSSAVLVLDEWQFVAVTFTPSTTEGCRFYLNGEFLNAVDSEAITQNGNPLVLGKSQWGQFFDGGLDDVRLYDRVLDAAEIDTLYQNVRPYDTWKGARFTAEELADPSISGDTADVDADQLATLIEYALGLDPKTHSGSLAGCAFKLDGASRLEIEFTRHASHADIDLVLEWTAELTPVNWQPVAQSIAGGTVQVLNGAALVSESGDEPTTVKINPPGPVPHGFIRWKVERR